MSQLPLTLEADPGPPPRERLLELFAHDTAAVLRFIFDAMEWAEDEVEASRARHPDQADLLNQRAFCILQPRPDLFVGKAEHTARAHMRELLDRAATGEDVEPATAVEVCLALSHLSMAAPLRSRHQRAYEIAFVDAFGEEQARATLGAETVRRVAIDREQQLIQEVLEEVRRAVGDPERAKAWRREAADA